MSTVLNVTNLPNTCGSIRFLHFESLHSRELGFPLEDHRRPWAFSVNLGHFILKIMHLNMDINAEGET